jgi:hypothetical protein
MMVSEWVAVHLLYFSITLEPRPSMGGPYGVSVGDVSCCYSSVLCSILGFGLSIGDNLMSEMSFFGMGRILFTLCTTH